MSSRRVIKPQYVMGIDPSFTGTGIVTLNVDGRIADSRVFETSPKKSIIARVDHIWTEVAIALRMCYPKLVAIEGLAFQGTGKNVMGAGYLGYRLREHLEALNIPYIEPAPTALKKYVTGKGNCGKELILQQVYKRWGWEFDNNNIADAYGLAQIARGYLGEEEKLTSFQKEVLAVIRKEE